MVRIPAEVAGAVIGRGGENIKEIQRKTMTKIDFKDGKIIESFSSSIIDALLVEAHSSVPLYPSGCPSVHSFRLSVRLLVRLSV
jgi:predicted PilT family ATPase